MHMGSQFSIITKDRRGRQPERDILWPSLQSVMSTSCLKYSSLSTASWVQEVKDAVDKHSSTMRCLVAHMYRIPKCISSVKYIYFWLFSVMIMRCCKYQKFTDFRLLYWVRVLVTFVSYRYIIKWKRIRIWFIGGARRIQIKRNQWVW